MGKFSNFTEYRKTRFYYPHITKIRMNALEPSLHSKLFQETNQKKHPYFHTSNSQQSQQILQLFKVQGQKELNLIMNQQDQSQDSFHCQKVSNYENSASQSFKTKTYKRKKITKVIHTCCLSVKGENGQIKTTFVQKSMKFNFTNLQTIKKLSKTKAQKHDKQILEDFKKQKMNTDLVKLEQYQANHLRDQWLPYFIPNFFPNQLFVQGPSSF